MGPAELRAAYDEQVRRCVRSTSPAIERDEHVVREVRDDWSGVIWSDLEGTDADAAIAAQVERFASRRGRWEWKLYSYDRPADLPSRLRAAGLRPEPEEAVLVAAIDELDRDVPLPPGFELIAVEDEQSARALVALQDAVFGSPHPGLSEALAAALAERPPSAAALMVRVRWDAGGGRPTRADAGQ